MDATVVGVSTQILDIPTIRPHKMSVATMHNQCLVLVRITTSDGTEGIGEATTIGGLNYGGESPESMKTNIDRYFAPLLIGRPASGLAAMSQRIDKTIKDNRFAKCAIETALYDTYAKRLRVPLNALFGGAVHDRISVAWTLASGDTQKDIDEAQQMLNTRHQRIFKLKVGMRAPNGHMPTLIRQLRQLNTQVKIGLVQVTTLQQFEALKSGRIDIGVGRILLKDDEIERLVLTDALLVVALPITHRLADKVSVRLADIMDEPLILYPAKLRGPRTGSVQAERIFTADRSGSQ